MKAILKSIRPQHIENILNGKKVIEISKSKPKKCQIPFDVYIYCTKDQNKKLFRNLSNNHFFILNCKSPDGHNGKVLGKFTVNKIEKIEWKYEELYNHCEFQTETLYEKTLLQKSCLDFFELNDYLINKKGIGYGYAWYIDNLEIFDEPKDLRQFTVYSHTITGIGMDGRDKTFDVLKPLTRAPQNWCCVEDL